MLDRLDKLESDLTVISRLKPYAAVNYIRNGVGYEEYLSEYAEYRHIRVEELLEVLNELQEAAKGFQTLYEAWFQHMEEYTRDVKEQAEPGEKQGRGCGDVDDAPQLQGAGVSRCFYSWISMRERIPHRKATIGGGSRGGATDVLCGDDPGKRPASSHITPRNGTEKQQDVSRFLDELRAKPAAKS